MLHWFICSMCPFYVQLALQIGLGYKLMTFHGIYEPKPVELSPSEVYANNSDWRR